MVSYCILDLVFRGLAAWALVSMRLTCLNKSNLHLLKPIEIDDLHNSEATTKPNWVTSDDEEDNAAMTSVQSSCEGLNSSSSHPHYVP